MNAKEILDFIEEVGILKRSPRTGWIVHAIPNPESIADHCYRMSILAMILSDALAERGVPINTEKVMRLALLHEIAETRIGDIPFTTLKYITESVKSDAENSAAHDLLKPFGKIGKFYKDLWDEFENGNSLESKLVRAADKLELMIQVFEYEKLGYKTLDLFWSNDWNRQHFEVHPIVKEIMSLLEDRREKEIIRNA